MKLALLLLAVATTFLGSCSAAPAPKTLFVSAVGNDNWPGTLPAANRMRSDGPLATLDKALELAREFHKTRPNVEVRILLHSGEYLLEKPLALTAEDSGILITGYPGQVPVLTGEGRVTGWRRNSKNPNLWEAKLPGDWRFHELFVNGTRKQRARLPATGYYHAIGTLDTNHLAQMHFKKGDLTESVMRNGDAELVMLQAWAESRNRLNAVDTNTGIATLAGRVLINPAESNPRYFIENAPDVTQPGTWRLGDESGVVTYWPDAGEDMTTAKITAPRLFELVQIEGEAGHPVHDIIFDGITFAGTDWPLTGGNDVDDQAAVEIQGAIQARIAEDCGFKRCKFTRLGGYAVDFGHDCQNNFVSDCEMWDLGAGGVRLGDTDAGQAEKGPNFGNIVSDNHIHHIGLVQYPAVGVIGFCCQNALISHNEIDHTYYSTISVGWTWGYYSPPTRGNIIEFNHLHDIGQGMLSDMGGVYTLGPQPGTIVRNNLIHDVNVYGYGGWGLYTDEGSSGILLQSNIVYRCQTAGFHQHYGASNVIYNNIFALNHDHQLARTRNEKHLSFTFSNNIVYFSSGSLLGNNWSGTNFAMTHNIYFDTRAGNTHPPVEGNMTWGHWQAEGEDVDSRWFDPQFVNPSNGDFRLKPNSPAVKFGFHPLTIENIGPRKDH